MAGRTPFDLHADEIVDAAIAILNEQGLDGVSMRNVGARLGVSPVPLYRRVGNKDDLLDAMARRLLSGMAPEPEPGEPWAPYATRWAHAVRRRLSETADMRLTMGHRRAPFVDATRPLIDVLRSQGFVPDDAVRTARLLLWAVTGFAAVETHSPGVTADEADHLFDRQVRYVVDGIAADRLATGVARSAP